MSEEATTNKGGGCWAVRQPHGTQGRPFALLTVEIDGAEGLGRVEEEGDGGLGNVERGDGRLGREELAAVLL